MVKCGSYVNKFEEIERKCPREINYQLELIMPFMKVYLTKTFNELSHQIIANEYKYEVINTVIHESVLLYENLHY